MAFPPAQPTDLFDIAGQFLGDAPQRADGFAVDAVPGTSGYGTRQSRVSDFRPAINARNIMHWLVPEGPIVQMYINPQNVSYNYKKNISNQRTKGGYVLQYWGEELTTLNIGGTTGTSGIEGINVLHDIYRNEQLAFDPFALFLAAKLDQDTFGAGIISGAAGDFVNSIASGDNFLSSFLGASEGEQPASAQQPPTLASLAFTVELYWSGEVYRGYFTDFIVKESVDQLGLFNYDINFTVTQKRGFRQNFLGWHRSATAGPSNSDPQLGRPYSFGSLVSGDLATPRRENASNNGLLETVGGALESIVDPFDVF